MHSFLAYLYHTLVVLSHDSHVPISSRLLPYSKCRPQLAFSRIQRTANIDASARRVPSSLLFFTIRTNTTEKPRVDLPFYFRYDGSQRQVTHFIVSKPAMWRCCTGVQKARSNHKDDSIVMASILFVTATLVHEDAMERHGDLQSFCWETTYTLGGRQSLTSRLKLQIAYSRRPLTKVLPNSVGTHPA